MKHMPVIFILVVLHIFIFLFLFIIKNGDECCGVLLCLAHPQPINLSFIYEILHFWNSLNNCGHLVESIYLRVIIT